MPKFLTKRGLISAYGLACGYIERKRLGTVSVSLWSEHGVYHVRAHCSHHGRRFWESFRTLSAARKHYNHARALLVAKAS